MINWNYKNKVDVYCIPKADQDLVKLIKPDLDIGPWIAGGAALRWYEGKSLDTHDVDVFCSSPEQYKETLDTIFNNCQAIWQNAYMTYSILAETVNAITLNIEKHSEPKNSFGLKNFDSSWKVQVIKKYMPANLDELMEKFDISVCRVATDFKKFRIRPEAARDIKAKRLNFPNGLLPDSLKRILKYNAYGYTPDPDIWLKALEVPGCITSFDNMGDYDHAF